jgi:endonuclease-3
MAKIPVDQIREIIKPCGLSPAKSKAISRLSQILVEEYDGKVPDTFEALEALPGVGHKTASVVMTQIFGMPAFPVDTHIHRITRRLGLVPLKATPAAVHAAMADLTPPGETLPFHIHLITHGRRVCKAGRPLCEACVLRPECRHGTRAGRRGRKSPVKRL